ncbi:type IV pilin-like G/H family protein [Microcoleus sp. herbarium19]|uniref:type IV pilin-like G/H family protein n=1 Tax=unclassified Microcoleus TaxID=2642155 RepID=UPI002FD11956
MSQHDFKPASLFYKRPSKSASFLPTTGCGCLVLLMCILLASVIGVLVFSSFFLCGANKAKQSEAKQYVGSMNRVQQAQFAENGSFSTSVAALGLGIKTETANYKYLLRSTKQTAFNYAVSKQETERSYVGAVFLVPAKKVDANAAQNEMITLSILCEADDRGTIKPAEPISQNGKVICGKGTTEVTK